MTIKYQLLNGKVIQKTLTSHKFFSKFIFSFHFYLDPQVNVIPVQIITRIIT